MGVVICVVMLFRYVKKGGNETSPKFQFNEFYELQTELKKNLFVQLGRVWV
jgi:hypothetical protein